MYPKTPEARPGDPLGLQGRCFFACAGGNSRVLVAERTDILLSHSVKGLGPVARGRARSSSARVSSLCGLCTLSAFLVLWALEHELSRRLFRTSAERR